jgi:hypothetical protein
MRLSRILDHSVFFQNETRCQFLDFLYAPIIAVLIKIEYRSINTYNQTWYFDGLL